MKQNDLTLVIPIIQDQHDALANYFKKNRDTILENFSKSLLIHSANFSILKHIPDKNISYRLLLTCNYDGDIKTLLINSSNQTHAHHINEVFKHCKGYEDGTVFNATRFKTFIDRYSINCNIFLFAFQGISVNDILTSNNLRDQLDHILDSTVSAIPAKFSRRIKISRKNPSVKNTWFTRKSKQLFEYLAGIRQGINNPTERVNANTGLYEFEDTGSQNRLTVLVPVKPHILYWRRLLILITLYKARQNETKKGKLGRISGLTTVHSARWVFIDGGHNLLFEANYDGSFESYIDDFVDRISVDLNCLWGHCSGFPLRGSKDIEAFKKYIRQNQVPGAISYQKYPDLSVCNILTNLSVSGIPPYNRSQGLQRYICGSYQA